MTQQKKIITFNDYLRKKYNCKVYRIPLNTGLICPNRLNGNSSCIYCDEFGSGARLYPENIQTIAEQVKYGIELFSQTRKAEKFYVYFQSFSNTFGNIETLKKLYDSAFIDDRICGLIIGTRPDCINNEILELINSYSKKYDVWLELGLQSANNKTLEFIKRGHTLEDYFAAADLCHKYNLKIVTHIILGLPYETKTDMINTAKAVKSAKSEGIKIHSLYIIKNTELAKIYETSKFQLLTFDEYVNIVCEIIKDILPAEIIYHRLTGETDNARTIAPEWIKNKTAVLNAIKSNISTK